MKLNILVKKPTCGTCINNGAGTFSLLETASENNTSPSLRAAVVVNESKKIPQHFPKQNFTAPASMPVLQGRRNHTIRGHKKSLPTQFLTELGGMLVPLKDILWLFSPSDFLTFCQPCTVLRCLAIFCT